MHYLIISFTHKNTDIEVREKLSFSNEEKKCSFMEMLNKNDFINESIVLSTCNRVEIIASVRSCPEPIDFIFETLAQVSSISKEELEGRADIYEDNGAIHHLFSVASSLDSLVIGETQIVGQLKEAFKFSVEKGLCSQKLSRAMHHAFRCAAAVRASTDISKNPISVSSVAVSQAKDILGDISGMTAVLVGAGEMSALAGKHLIANRVNVIVVNRNIAKAEELVEELGDLASAEPFSKLKELINKYHLVFSATGAPHSVITKDMAEEKDFQRYWFDIAVPRDIDECGISSVHIFAVDDLEEIVTKNLAMREEQAKIAYSIVGRSTMEFFKWLQTLSIDPIIKELRDKARQCSQKELERSIKKGYVPKEYEEAIEKILHCAFNGFLHTPTKNLKTLAEKPEADTIVQSVQEIFDINDEEVKKLNMYKCEYKMDYGE